MGKGVGKMAGRACMVLAMVVLVMTMTGCGGGYNLHRDFAVKAPENPDVTFIIKKFPFEKPHLNAYGVRMPMTGMRTGDTSSCLAEAMAQEFPNSRIVFEGAYPGAYIIETRDVEFGGNFQYSSYCKMKITLNGKDLEEMESNGPFRSVRDDEWYFAVCGKLAKRIKESLVK